MHPISFLKNCMANDSKGERGRGTSDQMALELMEALVRKIMRVRKLYIHYSLGIIANPFIG